MIDYPNVAARVVPKDGKLKVLCGRKNESGHQRCQGEFGTLVVYPDHPHEDAWVRLEPNNEWHRMPDGILHRKRPRRKLTLQTIRGDMYEKDASLALTSALYAPAICRCPNPKCREPNRIDLALLATRHREKPSES